MRGQQMIIFLVCLGFSVSLCSLFGFFCVSLFLKTAVPQRKDYFFLVFIHSSCFGKVHIAEVHQEARTALPSWLRAKFAHVFL